jgi:hypothetical protein
MSQIYFKQVSGKIVLKHLVEINSNILSIKSLKTI